MLSAAIGTTMASGCSDDSKKYEKVANDIKLSGYSYDECGYFYNNDYADEAEKTDATNITKKIIGDNLNCKFEFLHVHGLDINEDLLSSLLEEGKEVGIIYTPSDNTYASSYDSVDFIKSILAKYNINCPIFFNVSANMKYLEANCKLGDAVCTKLAANGCYVGFFGNIDELKAYNEAFKQYRGKSIDAYDRMTLIDYKEMCDILDSSNSNHSFNDLGNYIALPDGTILSKYNLAKIIEENKINEKENFQDDEVYVVKSGDTLTTIAKQYGMKDDNGVRYDILQEYNAYDANDTLQTGDHIVIPTIYDEKPIYKVVDGKLSLGKYEDSSVVVDGDAYGIDVSDYQNKIDWEEASKNIDFAIVKLRDFASDKFDAYYDYNISECNRLGIPVGVYYFPRALTEDDAGKEIAEVIKKLKDYQINLPVYIDIEDPDLKLYMRRTRNRIQTFNNIINVVISSLKDNGYKVGLYGNANDMDGIFELDCEYWFTGPSETYDAEIKLPTIGNLKDKYEEIKYDFTNDNGEFLCQHTSNGVVPGINGLVDINHCSHEYLNHLIGKENEFGDYKVKIYH